MSELAPGPRDASAVEQRRLRPGARAQPLCIPAQDWPSGRGCPGTVRGAVRGSARSLRLANRQPCRGAGCPAEPWTVRGGLPRNLWVPRLLWGQLSSRESQGAVCVGTKPAGVKQSVFIIAQGRGLQSRNAEPASVSGRRKGSLGVWAEAGNEVESGEIKGTSEGTQTLGTGSTWGPRPPPGPGLLQPGAPPGRRCCLR